MKIAWIDKETGGLDPKLHDITQIAAILEIDGRIVDELNLLVRPTSADRVSQEALDITKKTLEQVMAHPLSMVEAHAALVGALARFVNKYDREDKFIWAGQVPRFDMDFGREMFRRVGDAYFGSWFWPNPADLSGLVMALRMMGHFPKLKNCKLASVAEELKITHDAHEAMSDIRVTRKAFYHCARMVKAPDPVLGQQDLLAYKGE